MKRRSTHIPMDRQPWWSHPVFLLPILVSTGLFLMVLTMRIFGLGS